MPCWGSPGLAHTTAVFPEPLVFSEHLLGLSFRPCKERQLAYQAQSGGVQLPVSLSIPFPQALQLVGELDRAEHWLQGVAGSLSEPAAMKNPEELRRDLQDIGSLENQLLLWGIRLQALREEMGREPSTGHEAAGRIQRKVETVEEK